MAEGNLLEPADHERRGPVEGMFRIAKAEVLNDERLEFLRTRRCGEPDAPAWHGVDVDAAGAQLLQVPLHRELLAPEEIRKIGRLQGHRVVDTEAENLDLSFDFRLKFKHVVAGHTRAVSCS